MAPSDLLNNIDSLHTTPMGLERIRKNLALDMLDVLGWCKSRIAAADGIERRGKNYYVRVHGAVITVNAHSYTIITAHKGE